MIKEDYLFSEFNQYHVFEEDARKIHKIAATFNDKFDVYDWAASEQRSVLRQVKDASVEYGLFEPIPNSYFLAIWTPWDINSKYFVQTFKA